MHASLLFDRGFFDTTDGQICLLLSHSRTQSALHSESPTCPQWKLAAGDDVFQDSDFRLAPCISPSRAAEPGKQSESWALSCPLWPLIGDDRQVQPTALHASARGVATLYEMEKEPLAGMERLFPQAVDAPPYRCSTGIAIRQVSASSNTRLPFPRKVTLSACTPGETFVEALAWFRSKLAVDISWEPVCFLDSVLTSLHGSIAPLPAIIGRVFSSESDRLGDIAPPPTISNLAACQSAIMT